MRLDKFVGKSTQLNKSEVSQVISNGQVSVNGSAVMIHSTQVHENNQIAYDGKLLKPRPFRYLLMNKPAGVICSNVDDVYPSLFNTIDIDRVSELHIAGRLDADTTGLVLITDDGRWTYNITQPTKECEKRYRVGLSRAITDDVAIKFKQGIQLQGEDQLTLPATLTVVTPKEVILTLTQGKFHQVKRMFMAVGNRVVSLHREKIGELSLDVELGQWRYLTPDEINSFGD